MLISSTSTGRFDPSPDSAIDLPAQGQRLASGDLVVQTAKLAAQALAGGGIKHMMGMLLGALGNVHNQGLADAIVHAVFVQIADDPARVKATRLLDPATGNIVYHGAEAAIVLKPDGSIFYGRIPFVRDPHAPRPGTPEFWRPENAPWMHKVDSQESDFQKGDKHSIDSLAW